MSKKKQRRSRRPSERNTVVAPRSSVRRYAIGALAVLTVLVALVAMKQLSTTDGRAGAQRSFVTSAPPPQTLTGPAAAASQTVATPAERQPAKPIATQAQDPVPKTVHVAIPPPKSELERIAQSAALTTAARIAGRGTTVNAGFPLPSLQGVLLGPASYPDKVVVVNFWATWCGPCKKEIPDLQDLFSDYHARGLEILGVSLDGSADVVRSYAEQSAINYVVLLGNAEVGRQYDVTGIPTTLLYDRQGKMVRRLVGTQTRDSLEAAIKPLL